MATATKLNFGAAPSDWNWYWLDPDGQFHLAPSGHDDWATDHSAGDTDALLERGWVRVTAWWVNLTTWQLVISGYQLNRQQRASAERAAIAQNATLIWSVDGKGAEHVLYAPPKVQEGMARRLIELQRAG